MSENIIQQEIAEFEYWYVEPPKDLIFDDGEPMETNRHRIAMNTLIESLQQFWQGKDDYFVGGNMFVYYSSQQVRNRDYKGPDFFVVLNVDGSRPRQGWVVWDEEGRYPDVIIELMSPTTASNDLGHKKDIYQNTFKTHNYFVFDPFEAESLQGWSLNSENLYESIIPDERGFLWSQTLGLWLGIWEGTIQRETGIWLRFYDSQGNLVLLPSEAEAQRAEAEAQRANAEKQKADRLAARLRELGENPDLL